MECVPPALETFPDPSSPGLNTDLLNLSDTLRVGKPSAEQVPPEGESVEPEEHEEKDRHTPERRSNIGHPPQTADKCR